MEGKVVMMCAVIGFLGLSSVILGFAAESTRIKVRKNYKWVHLFKIVVVFSLPSCFFIISH